MVTEIPPKIVPPHGGQQLNVLGDNVFIKLRAEDTNGAYTLIEQRTHAGTGIPLHVHENEEETFFIVSGAYEFTLESRKFTALAGTTVHLPRGLPHAFQVVEGTPAHALVFVQPSGIEKMLEELGALPFPPAMGQAVAICARYGVHFLPPES